MSVALEVVQFLVQLRLTIATAEPCTAGVVASRIAEVPGSGRALQLAVVTYAPEAKI